MNSNRKNNKKKMKKTYLIRRINVIFKKMLKKKINKKLIKIVK